ncbi:hypothetical protein ACJVC5_10245 [Peredibacter sp. HCB2-198]|uniref:hypothetical protein n=1 Tax=Peredibacter sp. HCB2-198 TaxID=3383025 RepID=UPI0038B505C8
MIKRWPYFIILVVVAGGVLYLWKKETPVAPPAPSTAKKTSATPPSSTPPGKTFQIDGKKVVGLSPGKEEEEIKKLKVANAVSPEWQENLEVALKAQGGQAIKDIAIQKVDSFIWAQDGVALNVESVIVTLKNQKNEETTFRVLVDAQTGKILKNWDRPVFDPANPRQNFGIKVDSRYHND